MRDWRNWVIGVVGVILVLSLVGWLVGGGNGYNTTRRLGPEAQKAQKAANTLKDQLAADEIIDRAFSQPVRCGDAARSPFKTVTKEGELPNRYWFYQWPEGTIECFNSPGTHRIAGVELLPLGKTEAGRILGDPAKYPPSSTFFAPPPTAPPVSSLPELGTKPCCQP